MGLGKAIYLLRDFFYILTVYKSYCQFYVQLCSTAYREAGLLKCLASIYSEIKSCHSHPLKELSNQCCRVTNGYDVIARFLGAAASVFSATVDERWTLDQTPLDNVIHRAGVVPERLDHACLVLHSVHTSLVSAP